MAQGYTDFSAYSTISDFLAEWTPRIDGAAADFSLSEDAAFIGGKAVRITNTVTKGIFATANSIDAQSDRADVEVYLSYYQQSTTGQLGVFAAGRINGTGQFNSAGSNWYAAQDNFLDSNYRAYRRLNGSFYIMDTVNGGSGIPRKLVRNCLRIRINGTSIKTKHWLYSDGEPSIWTSEVVDTQIPEAGWAGFGVGVYSAQNDLVDYDEFGWGTGGDVAPSESVIITPTLTLPNVTGITATSVTPNATVTF